MAPTRILIKELLAHSPVGEVVLLCGWIRTRRDSKGGFSFLEINDGSSFRNVQVVAYNALSNYETEVLHLLAGASVQVRGKVVTSEGGKQSVEIRADSLLVLGATDESYPLQKKRHSFEYLRSIAHLRPRTNTFGAVARIRNALSFAVHSFFQENHFLYVHTPIITTSDCEGAGKMFQVTTLDMMNLPKGVAGVDYEEDFFGKKAHLTVSGQLEGEIFATALGRVYTFGPTFRAENSNTPRHLAEFWMVEPEMAFCDLAGDMQLAQDFIKYIFSYVLEHCSEDIAFFNEFVDKNLFANLNMIVKSRFEHITYTEAIKLLLESSQSFEFKVEWGCDLQAEHERYLTEQKVKGPVILTDYPKGIKAFYMRDNEDNKTVAAMDVLLPKIGEIIGGSQREERYDVLLSKIKAMGLNPEDYSWYLELRKYGTVPHAGFGLGFERAVQFITGMENIRDVIPFPRTPKSALF